jgi:hypothetical protein
LRHRCAPRKAVVCQGCCGPCEAISSSVIDRHNRPSLTLRDRTCGGAVTGTKDANPCQRMLSFVIHASSPRAWREVEGGNGAVLKPAAKSWAALKRGPMWHPLRYLAPLGHGLRVDFGKFVTHIGGETIESIKNINYSRTFFFPYAISFQDLGLRTHDDWTEAFYTEFYLLNGWNVTSDNNKAMTFGPSMGWSPSPSVSLTLNYLVGNEQSERSSISRGKPTAHLRIVNARE